ncbi:MAG: sigma 54-interacting transcriptional regulator [Alphaproteobacteria bacterium]|nr:sigma 54-interacting transcriptional regulator [Alphaproteobacteria bacterium]
MLYGKTGVGKTLIARYLQNNPGERPVRIVIPEYLNKEDMFEYALFGYVKGAYTGGRESGDHGLLLENVGRVVFLDEIGEANDIIQAKLLAYLDDYHVRPRGWQGDPFYCPTLVVAATNRDLDDMVEKKQFRADLLMRFTDRETIPTLRERVDSFPFILDCLLQNNAINPGWGKKGESCVKEIGNEALEALKKYEFPGNFRELENILRTVCREVLKDGRDYICRSDLPICKCDE